MNLVYLLDGTLTWGAAFEGYSLQVLVAIIMVFAILGIIIGITTLVFKLTGLFDLKKELDEAKKTNKGNTTAVVAPVASKEVNINDEDMMVAALVASIDYRNEVKTDVRVVSIKEIK